MKFGKKKTENEVREKPVKEKKVKVKKEKVKKERKPKNGEKKPLFGAKKEKRKFYLLGIRNKISICFAIPILFMVLVGVMAYQKAQEGMSDKFAESTIQTIGTATSYVEMAAEFINSEGMGYAFDSDLTKYFAGMYESDAASKAALTESIKGRITSSQAAN